MLGDCEIVNPDKAKMEADHIDSQIIEDRARRSWG